MQEKLIEIMSGAKGWMTAAEIAEKGKWRSAQHVGLALKQMADVEHRTSPTKKSSNGMPAKEYKLSDKSFVDDACVQQKAKSETQATVKQSLTVEASKPVVKESLTTEANLRQQVAHLTGALAAEKSNIARLNTYLTQAERQRDEHLEEANKAQNKAARLEAELKVSETAVINWLDLARDYECKTIPELRVFIGALVERVESLRLAKSENVALKTLNGEMPGFGALHQALTEGPFVVRTPSKPPRFTKKQASAHATAMSAARQHGFSEVFALVPVGKAIRGAEWRPK